MRRGLQPRLPSKHAVLFDVWVLATDLNRYLTRFSFHLLLGNLSEMHRVWSVGKANMSDVDILIGQFAVLGEAMGTMDLDRLVKNLERDPGRLDLRGR